MKILLALDDSNSSKKIIREATRRPWPAKSQIKILSVYGVHISPMARPWFLPLHEEKILEASRKHADVIVEKAASRLKMSKNQDFKILTEVIEGSPQQAILDEADRWRADLIMIGSHGLGEMDRILLGSVSHNVAIYAKCSVEIVR